MCGVWMKIPGTWQRELGSLNFSVSFDVERHKMDFPDPEEEEEDGTYSEESEQQQLLLWWLHDRTVEGKIEVDPEETGGTFHQFHLFMPCGPSTKEEVHIGRWIFDGCRFHTYDSYVTKDLADRMSSLT